MAYRNRGFSLLELISIMVIIGITSIVFLPRVFDTGTSALQSGRDDLVAALFYAQQIAMARNDSVNNPITFVIVDNNTITVRENGTDLTGGGVSYPLDMPAGVTLLPASLTRTYDQLGRTAAADITLSANGVSAVVNLQASGYANQ